MLVVDEVASTLLPGLDHGGRRPLLASQITAAMQWILSINLADGPMETLSDRIPLGRRKSVDQIERLRKGSPSLIFLAAAGQIHR